MTSWFNYYVTQWHRHIRIQIIKTWCFCKTFMNWYDMRFTLHVFFIEKKTHLEKNSIWTANQILKTKHLLVIGNMTISSLVCCQHWHINLWKLKFNKKMKLNQNMKRIWDRYLKLHLFQEKMLGYSLFCGKSSKRPPTLR